MSVVVVSLKKKIDLEIQNRSLLKHTFYQKWYNGELTLDHLQLYSKYYSQLVNAITKKVYNVFFFQAEDGIRDYKVTGVQTCALPISRPSGQDRRSRGGCRADPEPA